MRPRRNIVGAEYPKPLPSGEIDELLVRAKAGDTQARNQLILHNMRMCARAANQLSPGEGIAQVDDLIQIGALALARAVDSFDHGLSNGCSFATYAWHAVHFAIREEVEQRLAVPARNASENILEAVADPSEVNGVGFAVESEHMRKAADAMASCIPDLEPKLRRVIWDELNKVPKAKTAESLGLSTVRVGQLAKQAYACLYRLMCSRGFRFLQF